MKTDIHPDVRRDARSPAPAAARSPRAAPRSNGVIHADVCSACHPFYTGKQKILDTGGRVAKFEKRFGAKTARCEVARPTAADAQHAAPTAPYSHSGAAPFAVRAVPTDGDADVRARRGPGRRVRRPRAAARRPGDPRRPGRRPDGWAGASPSSAPVVETLPRVARGRGRPRRRRELAERGRRPSRAEAVGADGPPGRARGRAAPPARPARPRRRPRRHPRGQGGRGRRRVGAVRRRPAADVPALRRAPWLEDRGPRRPGVRPRRLQGRVASP